MTATIWKTILISTVSFIHFSVLQVITGVTKSQLPEAYKQSHLDPNYLDTFVRLCLADPSFPGFVGQVEKSLTKLMKEAAEIWLNQNVDGYLAYLSYLPLSNNVPLCTKLVTKYIGWLHC